MISIARSNALPWDRASTPTVSTFSASSVAPLHHRRSAVSPPEVYAWKLKSHGQCFSSSTRHTSLIGDGQMITNNEICCSGLVVRKRAAAKLMVVNVLPAPIVWNKAKLRCFHARFIARSWISLGGFFHGNAITHLDIV